jgi:excisionase family DNA binding protein
MSDQLSASENQQTIVPEAEAVQVEELHRLLQKGNATLTSSNGLHQLELPHPLYELLIRIINSIRQGKSVAYIPSTKDLTTRQAANLLGMSRQFLIGLLDKGEIAYHKVGTHRRLTLSDVLEYRERRDKRRHQAINEMARQAVELGIYDEL